MPFKTHDSLLLQNHPKSALGCSSPTNVDKSSAAHPDVLIQNAQISSGIPSTRAGACCRRAMDGRVATVGGGLDYLSGFVVFGHVIAMKTREVHGGPLGPFLHGGYGLFLLFLQRPPQNGPRRSAPPWRFSWKIWKNRCLPWLLPGSGHRTGAP